MLIIAALLSLAIAAGLTFRGRPASRPAPTAARSGTSLAVLPLRVLSGDPATGRRTLTAWHDSLRDPWGIRLPRCQEPRILYIQGA